MLPFYVLLISFSLSGSGYYLLNKSANWPLAGRIALSLMLCLTAMGHFMFTEGMAMMLPEFVPAKIPMVYFTGVIEMAAAFGIHLAKTRKLTGILLMLFFVLVLPANIKAAFENLNYQTGTYDGPGLSYLWFRVPFQLLLIAWTYWFVLGRKKKRQAK